MKHLNYLILSTVLMGVSIAGYSQKQLADPKYGPDTASRKECLKALSTMGQFYKIDMHKEAYVGWTEAFHRCPGSSKNIYIKGEKIIENLIKDSDDPAYQKAMKDTLYLLYDTRIEYFGQEGFVLGKKGVDMIKYSPDSIETAYSIMGKSIQLEQTKSKPSVIVTFIQSAYALYRAGIIEPAKFVNDYVLVADIVANHSRPGSQIERATETVEKIFAESGAADCETLVTIFTPKFEANPDDVELLKKITELLNNADCHTSDLYANASEKLYELEPSAQSAYNLARLFVIRNEIEKASEYYLNAIKAETDMLKVADYYVELASITFSKQSDKPLARTYARKAIEANPNKGDAYILIGNLYASSASECGDNNVEKASVYWIAVDKYKKAKAVDTGVNEKANDLINRYSQYFPSKEDAFFYNLIDGNDYTVKCWINEETTVRTAGN